MIGSLTPLFYNHFYCFLGGGWYIGYTHTRICAGMTKRVRRMLSKMELLIVRGLCQHFQDVFWFPMLKMVLNDLGVMFRVILLLQNKFVANHTPPWWYCMMGKYLLVFLSIKNAINPDQIFNSICRNAAPNLQGTCTMLHCCLQTLIIVPLLQPFGEQTPFCYSQFFQILPHQSRTPVAIFQHRRSYAFMWRWVAWPCFHVEGMAVWPWRPFFLLGFSGQ